MNWSRWPCRARAASSAAEEKSPSRAEAAIRNTAGAIFPFAADAKRHGFHTMQCDVCKQKKATVFLTQIIKGEMQKVNLCEGCSREKGVTDPTGFALTEMLMGFTHGEKLENQPQERTCSACGMPQTTFRKTGRLGCAECYKVFGEGLDNLLKAMHKGTRHTGKAPAGRTAAAPTPPPAPRAPATPKTPPPVKAPALPSLESRLADMRARLDAAVAKENFEDAARLRDEIQRLQSTV
jgi:protein arginine kinase activator